MVPRGEARVSEFAFPSVSVRNHYIAYAHCNSQWLENYCSPSTLHPITQFLCDSKSYFNFYVNSSLGLCVFGGGGVQVKQTFSDVRFYCSTAKYHPKPLLDFNTATFKVEAACSALLGNMFCWYSRSFPPPPWNRLACKSDIFEVHSPVCTHGFPKWFRVSHPSSHLNV